MKTIEVSDEMYEKLVELAKEMTTQDPRATRMPHLFQIRDWKKVYDSNCNGDTKFWLDTTYDPIEIEDVESLLSYLESNEIEHDAVQIREMWDDGYGGMEDWIEENCPNLQMWSYSMEPVYTNSFLTAKAAQEHLDRNHYHYHQKADVYLNHAWRNPEAELVSEFLCGLIGKPMHT